jgi:lipopolysaccharide export system permease protein
MLVIVDSLGKIGTEYKTELNTKIEKNLMVDSSYVPTASRGNKNLSHIYLRVENIIRTTEGNIRASIQRIITNKKDVNRFWVEIHKKYSIPAACIVFILLGAPLGTMTRKGGFGMAAGISLIFFLIYWAFLIGGEKLADRGLISPFWGMWSANFLMAALGIWLLVKSARERVTISFDWLQKLIPKQMRSNQNSDENT